MAFSFYRTLTIDATKCGSANTTDFPLLFSGTYTYLKTAGNGGDITNANGYDIAFYADSAGSTPLDFELVNYGAATGTVEFWVRIPTLSHTVDTVIYLFYKNASITTNQSTTSTWTSSFKRVYHFPNGVSVTGGDSTANAVTATLGGSAVAGQIDGGLGVSSGSSCADTGLASAATSRTISGWFDASSISGGSWAPFFVYGTDIATQAIQIALFDQGGGNKAIIARAQSTSTGTDLNAGSLVINTGTWYHFALTYDSATNAATLYLSGAQVSTGTRATWSTVLNGTVTFNTNSVAMDELRFRNAVESASEILSGYNNQLSPSTFYAVGAAVPIGGGGAAGSFNLGRVIGFAGSTRIH